MAEFTETVKVYVQDDNCITIKCPDCSQPACIKVESFRNKCHTFKVRCTCKAIFKVEVDYRRFYRKPTRIAGIYRSIKPPRREGGEILIINLSKEGIGFKAFTEHDIRKGNTLRVSFELDDHKKSYLQKKVKVQSINKDVIGCRFLDPDLFETALGFYLQHLFTKENIQ